MIEMDGGVLIFVAALAVIVFLVIFLWLVPIGLWFNALVNGVRVSLLQLILMRWRKVPPGLIVNTLIMGTKAGIALNKGIERNFGQSQNLRTK